MSIEKFDSDHVETGGVGSTFTEEELAKADIAVRRKIDFQVLPSLAILFFLSSLDRSDIGNAKTAGMAKALKLTKVQYSNCVSMFYVTYIVFQLPSALSLRYVSPPLLLAIACTFWGLMTTLMGTANSYGVLITLRLLLGVGESCIQASTLYGSLWYRKDELAKRGAAFFGVATLAGAFGGLVAYACQVHLSGAHGRAAWSWIFIIEGIPSVGFGLILYFLIPPVPEKAKRGFTPVMQAAALLRTKRGNNQAGSKIVPSKIIPAIYDPKNLLLYLAYGGLLTCLTSFGNFLPTILTDLGYTSVHAQIMTVPIYAVACVFTLAMAYLADKTNARSLCLMGSLSTLAVGYIITLSSRNTKALYFALVLVGMGGFGSVVNTSTWLQINNPDWTSRSTGMATINIFGQSMSLMSSYLYVHPPRNTLGNSVALGMSLLALICITTNRFYLQYLNRKQEEKYPGAVAVPDEPLTLESPAWRYNV